MPNAVTVEINVNGAWIDVTQWADWSAGASTRYGRTSPYSGPQPAMFGMTFVNDDGRFTPKRQVLVDGVTAHPYYPYLIPRMPIRFSYTVAGTKYYRFTGRVKGWPPAMRDTYTPRVTITAIDDMDRLSRVNMSSGIGGEILNDNPVAYWPLTEAAGSVTAAAVAGAAPLYLGGSGTALTFGNPGPGVDQGTAVAFNSGLWLYNRDNLYINLTALSVSCWVKYTTVGSTIVSIVSILARDGTYREITTGTAGAGNGIQWRERSGASGNPSSGLATSPGALNDGLWHHVVVTQATASSAVNLYVDGVLTSGFNGFDPFASIRVITLGTGVWAKYTGSLAHVAIYDYVLTATQVTNQFLAAQQSGELVSDKVKRFLSYAGLAAADWNIDTSAVVTGSYAQDGQNVAQACQDMATTEGNGSVFYFTPDGLARFTNRAYRKPGAPGLTVDAGADLDGGTYQPAYDDASLANRVVGSRATSGGAQSRQLAGDAVSQIRDGITDAPFTSYAADDADVLGNAQLRLAQQRVPAFRLDQVAVDLATATGAGLYAAVAACRIGTRLLVTSLYAAAAPAAQLPAIVEGWADTFDGNQYTVVFDTSPADTPAMGLYDDAAYGRYQALPDCGLNAAVTSSATTVIIATPTPPAFTVAAVYPLKITIEGERLQLNSAPGGSTSPQTFTGVTRGVDGTPAAAHPSGAQVAVWPAATFTL